MTAPSIYIAGSSALLFESPRIDLAFMEAERIGFRIAYDWRVPVREYTYGLPKQDVCRDIAEREIEAVKEADYFWLLSGGKTLSMGAHVELGMRLASGKPVIISGTKRTRHLFYTLADEVFLQDGSAVTWLVFAMNQELAG